jgi:uncharacterized membrane protein
MTWFTWLWIVSAIGSGLISGIFLGFSNFIMAGLARVKPEAGIASMQAINVTVLNPLFLGLFMSTALTSVVSIIAFWFGGDLFALIAGLLYLLTTFFLTAFGNVPLNDRLAAVDAASAEAEALWKHYLVVWVRLNTIRTIASGLASCFWVAALMQ